MQIYLFSGGCFAWRGPLFNLLSSVPDGWEELDCLDLDNAYSLPNSTPPSRLLYLTFLSPARSNEQTTSLFRRAPQAPHLHKFPHNAPITMCRFRFFQSPNLLILVGVENRTAAGEKQWRTFGLCLSENLESVVVPRITHHCFGLLKKLSTTPLSEEDKNVISIPCDSSSSDELIGVASPLLLGALELWCHASSYLEPRVNGKGQSVGFEPMPEKLSDEIKAFVLLHDHRSL
ncbi:hypothetical protein RRG08_005105 [Elysia crispata]|uniref:Uncharacterized protein n=1 Tax=Elysia crispata TaxID=231223 RepID=A0AAE1CWZ2_9GAST|nr:hypothetical protein RRG08_005105 [Elysia crispata]